MGQTASILTLLVRVPLSGDVGEGAASDEDLDAAHKKYIQKTSPEEVKFCGRSASTTTSDIALPEST